MQHLKIQLIITIIALYFFSPTLAQVNEQLTTPEQDESTGPLITPILEPVLEPALEMPELPVVQIGVNPPMVTEVQPEPEAQVEPEVQPELEVQPEPEAQQTTRSFLPQGLANIFQRQPQVQEPAATTQDATQTQDQTAQTNYASLKEGFEQGNLASDFMLLNMEGQTVQLSSLRGRPVVLNFWGLNCPPCIEELPILQKADREINGQYRGLNGSTNAHFILVALKSNTEETKPFLEELGIQMNTLIEATVDQESNLPYTINDTESVFRMYRAFGLPTTFLLDHTGIIQSKRVGAFINEEELSHYLKSVGVNWQPVQF